MLLYLDLLRDHARQNANFDLQLVDSNEKGYLTLDQEEIPDQSTLFICVTSSHDEGPCQANQEKRIPKQNSFTKVSSLNKIIVL